MQNIVSTPQIELYPDREEKKLIRKKYAKVALVIIINIILFNYVLRWGFKAGVNLFTGYSFEDYELVNPVLYSYARIIIPIVSQIVAITVGIFLVKPNLKSLFNFNGFSFTTLIKIAIVGISVQTATSFVVVFVNFIMGLFGVTYNVEPIFTFNEPYQYTLFLYFYVCILGPIIEEVFYRGLLLQGLRKYNERFAIIITSLIFGLMHQNFNQFVLAATFGIVLSAVTLKSGSIFPAIFAHIIVNTSGVLTQVIAQHFDPSFMEKATSAIENPLDYGRFSPESMAFLVLNSVVRFGLLAAGIVIIIVALIKKGNFRKPIKAGINRGFPILFTSPLWYIIFAVYIYFCFIQPIQTLN